MAATGDIGQHNGPTVFDNTAPGLKSNPLTGITLQEDDPPTDVDLKDIFHDIDVGDPLDYTLWDPVTGAWTTSTENENFTAGIIGTNLEITPKQDEFGVDILLLNVSDSYDFTIVPKFEFTVTIESVNDVPQIDSIANETLIGPLIALVLNEDKWYDLNVKGSDIEGDTLTYSADFEAKFPSFETPGESEISHLTFDTDTGELLFMPLNSDVTDDIEITYTVSDGTNTSSATLQLKVLNENDPPSLTWINADQVTDTSDLVYTVEEDDELLIMIDAQDDDEIHGDVLTFFTNFTKELDDLDIDKGDNWDFDDEKGELMFIPDNSMVGTYWLEIGVRDKARDSDTTTIKLVVTNVNDPPSGAPFSWVRVRRRL